jgi:hypothetical protein
MIEIRGKKGRDIYYYDEGKLTVMDKAGNCIKLYASLNVLSYNNKSIIIDELFHKLYIIQNEASKLCAVTKEKNIEWKRCEQ